MLGQSRPRPSHPATVGRGLGGGSPGPHPPLEGTAMSVPPPYPYSTRGKEVNISSFGETVIATGDDDVMAHLPLRMPVQSTNENSSLSFSKRERQTLL